MSTEIRNKPVMDRIPTQNDLTEILIKIFPPLIISIMSKLASEYKSKGRLGWVASFVIVVLSGCGAFIGYWISGLCGFTSYKMVLAIYFCSAFADKAFEILFSKEFAKAVFDIVEDWFVGLLESIVTKIKPKK